MPRARIEPTNTRIFKPRLFVLDQQVSWTSRVWTVGAVKDLARVCPEEQKRGRARQRLADELAKIEAAEDLNRDVFRHPVMSIPMAHLGS